MSVGCLPRSPHEALFDDRLHCPCIRLTILKASTVFFAVSPNTLSTPDWAWWIRPSSTMCRCCLYGLSATTGFVRYPAAGSAEIDDVARMLSIVEEVPATAAREKYQHIGDSTLFWSGLYPEALKQFRYSSRQAHLLNRDSLIDWRAVGKQAYWIASTLEPEAAAQERGLLEQLSQEFDLCVEGLSEVRRAWAEPA